MVNKFFSIDLIYAAIFRKGDSNAAGVEYREHIPDFVSTLKLGMGEMSEHHFN